VPSTTRRTVRDSARPAGRSRGADQPQPQQGAEVGVPDRGAQLAVIEARIRKARDWFDTVCPPQVNADQFVALAMGYVRKNDSLLAAAAMNPGSFMSALSECASLGLTVGRTYHLSYFRNTRTGIPDIVGMVDYKGEIEMIYRAAGASGLEAVHVDVVRRGGEKPDQFTWQRDMMRIPHHVVADGGLATEAERGPLYAVYAYATFIGGGVSDVVLLTRDQVAKHRDKARTLDFWGPEWPAEGDWTPDMWKKTGIHGLFDVVPHSAEYVAEMLRSAAAVASAPPAAIAPPSAPPLPFRAEDLALPDMAQQQRQLAGGTGGNGGELLDAEGLAARDRSLRYIAGVLTGNGYDGKDRQADRLAILRTLAVPAGQPPADFAAADMTLIQAQTAERRLAEITQQCERDGTPVADALHDIVTRYAQAGA